MLKKLSFLSLLVVCSCVNSKNKNHISSQQGFPDKCKKMHLYQFQDEFINLETLAKIEIDGLPAEDFKNCSKYAHRFKNYFTDSLIVQNRTFTITNDEETETYALNIFENQVLTKAIPLPVEEPLPEVHEYRFWLSGFQNSVIIMMDDFYSTFYQLVKYDIDGKSLMQKNIEHTYITHPEPHTNHHHPYLHYLASAQSHMAFSSHSPFSDKFKTVFLNLENFETIEFDQTAHALILDENEKEAIGFITYKGENKDETRGFQISMLDGKIYEFVLPYGSTGFDVLLKGNLLYITNYPPISFGASLHCFDMEKGEIKWTANVLSFIVDHSKYYNQVTLSLYKDKLIMEGNEAYGDYLQIFDAQSGKRLAEFGITP